MKEIGGYFGFETLISNEYHNELLKLNTCRNALIYLLKKRNIKKVYLPYYLCDSVSNACSKYDIAFEYYPVTEDFLPSIDVVCKENEAVYIVNYFGQISNEVLITLNKQYKRIVVDNSQAFFQKPLPDIDTIYSCRKFFGVPDGAYLHTNANIGADLDADYSKERFKHLFGRFESTASEYYMAFKENDKLLGEEPIKTMSKLTENLMGAIDYRRAEQKRTENFCYLHEHLQKRNILSLKSVHGAFAYPFYIEDGMGVKKHLAEKKIYIPTLWPNVLEDAPNDTFDYRYAKDILPIPCDQRYDISDMNYILEELECIL